LLRAWERRYGLLRPIRSSGGLRLYSPDDLERVRRMREHLAQGVAAAEAASLAAAPAAELDAAAFDPAAARAELARSLEAFDESGAQAAFDRFLSSVTLAALLSDVVLPYLYDLGRRWQGGELSVAQEHFASNVLRARLLGLARGWDRGLGPRALLACPSGERHDLGLIAFGLALRARGWRIHFLGSDTPVDSIAGAAESLAPELTVLAATMPGVLESLADSLRSLCRRYHVAVGGAAASGAAAVGAETLAGDPVREAERVAAAC
jgi:methanogenic corrinoid protein MtbC1